jgi:hypothetical protein
VGFGRIHFGCLCCILSRLCETGRCSEDFGFTFHASTYLHGSRPWQTCASGPAPPVGRITCDVLGNYIDNARLDYVVGDLTSSASSIVTTQPIDTRYGFGRGFFGDYTDIAAGSDDAFHALWTDSNNVQNVT